MERTRWTKLLINWRWLLVLQVIIVSALMLLFALTVSVSSVDETGMPRSRRDVSSRVKDIVLSLVLCLNASLFLFCPWSIFTLSHVISVNMVLWHIKHPRRTSTVNQTASIGQTLVSRDRAHIKRLTPSGSRLFDILFLQRGPMLSQERGFRQRWEKKYYDASMLLKGMRWYGMWLGRYRNMIESFLGGWYSKNAGVKIWILKGDKIESVRCIAVPTKLMARNQ